jgi:hypothetical protein
VCGVLVGLIPPVPSASAAVNCGGPNSINAILPPVEQGAKATLYVEPGTVTCSHINSLWVVDPYTNAFVEMGWVKSRSGGQSYCAGIPGSATYIFWYRVTPANILTCNYDSNATAAGNSPVVSVRYNNSTGLWTYTRNSNVETNWSVPGFSAGVGATNAERHYAADDDNADFSDLYYYNSSAWKLWSYPSSSDCDYEWDQTIYMYGTYLSVNVSRGTSGVMAYGPPDFICSNTR